ncbi:MAG: MFS transporter, partial [Alphaproteobacteria bacterium]|nr:MFS transporter [Alphaproteobacteria bacterium]
SGTIFTQGRGIRLLALSLINSPHGVIATIFPLVLTVKLGGSTAQLGWFAGFVALTEIPLMLVVGAAVSRFQLWTVIVTGGLVHAGYLALLGLAPNVATLFALGVLNAIGNAVMLTQHMSYCQDLMPDRPGLGSSLLSIVSLISKGLAAAVFAGVGLVYGFGGALATAMVICLVGCAGLMVLDRHQGRRRVTA